MSLISIQSPRSRAYGYSSSGSSDPYAMRTPTGSDIYVNPAAVTNGTGSIVSPYQPSQFTATVLQAVAPGQNLWVRTGSIAWPDTTGMQNGTSGNWVQVGAYPGESVTLTFTGIGARAGGSQYLRMYNLFLSANLSSGNGNGLMTAQKSDFSGGTPSQGLYLIDCGGQMNLGTGAVTDNSGLVRATDHCPDLRIIRGSWTGPSGLSNNQSLLWLDDQRGTQIIGALLDGSACPVYFKHTDSVIQSDFSNMLVKNCIVLNAGRGFLAAMNWCNYTNNAFYGSMLGLNEDGGGLPGGNFCTLRHNTFYSSDIAMNVASGNSLTLTGAVSSGNTTANLTSAWNPGGSAGQGITQWFVFSNGDIRLGTLTNQLTSISWVGGLSSSASTALLSGHACLSNVFSDNVLLGTTTYYDNLNGGAFAGYNQNNSIDYTATNTSNHYSRNSSSYTKTTYAGAFSPNEANGVSGTISLVGGTSPGSTPANWQLSPGSVGIGNASDGGDRGVNATNLLTVN